MACGFCYPIACVVSLLYNDLWPFILSPFGIFSNEHDYISSKYMCNVHVHVYRLLVYCMLCGTYTCAYMYIHVSYTYILLVRRHVQYIVHVHVYIIFGSY